MVGEQGVTSNSGRGKATDPVKGAGPDTISCNRWKTDQTPFLGHPAAGSRLAALFVIGRRQEPCLEQQAGQESPFYLRPHTEAGTRHRLRARSSVLRETAGSLYQARESLNPSQKKV